MKFAGQVALVTGAGGGLGEAMATRLAQEGAAVLVTDILTARAASVAASLNAAGYRALPFTMDVAKEDQMAAAVSLAEAAFGPLSIAICNASITDRAPALEMSPSTFEHVVRTNLTGCFISAQAAGRAMVQSGKGGRIITISSISGQRGGFGRAAYGASKAGVIGLTQVLAMEFAPHGILVNCVAPGAVQRPTTMHGPKQRDAFLGRMALQRYATPAEVAAAAVFLCTEDASFITGQVLNVDGGFTASGVLYDQDEAN